MMIGDGLKPILFIVYVAFPLYSISPVYDVASSRYHLLNNFDIKYTAHPYRTYEWHRECVVDECGLRGLGAAENR